VYGVDMEAVTRDKRASGGCTVIRAGFVVGMFPDARRCKWEGDGSRVSSEGGGGASGRECLPSHRGCCEWEGGGTHVLSEEDGTRVLSEGGGTRVSSEGGGGASGHDSGGCECLP